MSVAVRDSLEQLRDETNADTLTEVIRRALALYEFAWKARKKGAKLVLHEVDGSERDLVVFL